MTDIQQLLRAWGKWARQNADELGYASPMEVIMRGAPECCKEDAVIHIGRYDDVEFISDDKALVLDRIVGNLCRIHPVEGECLRMKYVGGMTPERIAKNYLTKLEGKNVGKYKAVQYISAAEGFVDGYIANM